MRKLMFCGPKFPLFLFFPFYLFSFIAHFRGFAHYIVYCRLLVLGLGLGVTESDWTFSSLAFAVSYMVGIGIRELRYIILLLKLLKQRDIDVLPSGFCFSRMMNLVWF